MILAVSKNIVGVITTSDMIRPHAKDTVDRLKSLGLEVGILTGDNRYKDHKSKNKRRGW